MATTPQAADGEVTLARDVELVRASMLYADEVRLVSPASELVLSMAGVANGDYSRLAQLFMAMPDEVLVRFNGGRALDRGFRRRLPLLSAAIATHGPQETLDQLRDTASRLMASSGGSEILEALKSNVVTLTSLAQSGDPSADTTTGAFVEELRALLQDSGWKLLVDAQTAGLVRALIAEKLVTPGAFVIGDAARAGVGTGVIARLPAFPQVPVSEILGLRADLKQPLQRYRQATVELSTKLRVGPFDRAFAEDVDEIYGRSVAPALEELRASLADHGLVRQVSRALRVDVGNLAAGAAGSTLGLAVSGAEQIDGWSQALLIGGPLALQFGSSLLAGQAGAREGKSSARRSDLFYLAEIDRRGGARPKPWGGGLALARPHRVAPLEPSD